MEINYFVILFIVIPLFIIVGFLYYLVNYLCVDHRHHENDVITDPRDLPELESEEKYPEDKVELGIIEEEDNL